MKKARMLFGALMAAAAISLSGARPLALAATPVPVTSVATQVAAPSVSATARVTAPQVMTVASMEATVGGGFFDWAKDFVEGMVYGIGVAVVVIIIIAI